jgi:fructokinase
LRILDINLRSPYWDREVIADSLALANVLKLNEEELPRVAGAVGLSGPEDDILRGLVSEYALRLVALTRGANGSVLLTATGERSESPGARVEVADTVGAGDAFTAVLALGLTHGLSLDTTHRWATAVAAFVCTKPGGTPTFPPELRLPDAGP